MYVRERRGEERRDVHARAEEKKRELGEALVTTGETNFE